MVTRPEIGLDDRVASDFLMGSVAGILGTPDIALLVGLLLVFAASALRTAKLPEGERGRLILAAWLVAGFLAFYLFLPLAGFPFVMLPRYFALVIPVAVIGVGIAIGRVFGPGLLRIGWAGLLVASIANHSGALYLQPALNNTVYQEHADGNAQLLLLIQDGFAELERIEDAPLLLDRNQWFRATYPAAGYVRQPLTNVLRIDDYRDGDRFDQLPDEFVLLDSEVAGSKLPALIEPTLARPVVAGGDHDAPPRPLRRVDPPVHRGRTLSLPWPSILCSVASSMDGSPNAACAGL